MSRGVTLNFDAIAAIGFILIYCVASLITVGGAGGRVTGWGDDWAQYIMHARAITQGRAYSDIGYIWSIYAPLIGPPAYPPGTAFVLGIRLYHGDRKLLHGRLLWPVLVGFLRFFEQAWVTTNRPGHSSLRRIKPRKAYAVASGEITIL